MILLLLNLELQIMSEKGLAYNLDVLVLLSTKGFHTNKAGLA
jgi:hypothetical protein